MRHLPSSFPPPPHPSQESSGRWFALLFLALLVTLLNAFKPLHMDDVSFHCHAAQLAAHPLSPYDFEILCDHVPRPAVEILAPPVWPYWWGLGMRLLGDQPLLWKLWLLPVNLLLVYSLHALLRRFVCRFELPLLWMTVLSPAFLPGLNLMSDIPALSLSLFAVVIFLRAGDRQSVGLASLAGLTAGLAMQTKYTGFITPGVLLLYAILFRRIRLGLLAGSLAVLVFVAWEGLVVLSQGASPFLGHCAYFGVANHSIGGKLVRMLQALPTLAGGLAPAVMLLGLAALGLSRRVVLAAGLGVALGYLLLVIVPESRAILLRSPATGTAWLTLNTVLYGTLGIGICASTTAVVRRLLQPPQRQEAGGGWRIEDGGSRSEDRESRIPGSHALHPERGEPRGSARASRDAERPGSGCPRRAWEPGGAMSRFFSILHPRSSILDPRSSILDCFLVLWLGLELAGYFVLSPFPAARRILGVIVVGTLLVGRLAARTCRAPARTALLRGVAISGVVLGLGFHAVDWRDAWASKAVAERAAEQAQRGDAGTTAWFLGSWGFHFYAERAGLKPLVLGQSRLHQGDHLVVYDNYFFRPNWLRCLEQAPLETVSRVTVEDTLPLRLVVHYYAGAMSLRHHQGPRASATVYRVNADFVLSLPR